MGIARRRKVPHLYDSCVVLLLSGWLVGGATAQRSPTVEFNRDVRPILADNCFACHGPDSGSRKAGLRLDTRAGATAPLRDATKVAIRPGDPDTSELIARVELVAGKHRMPPPSSHKPRLSDRQIETLRRWISEGAAWEAHWSFQAPQVRSQVPAGVHPIDFFIERKLRRAGLSFSPEAEPHVLRRRLAFDLTGLPPTAEDENVRLDGDGYAAYVDRLLASPRYGERMAMWWLDRARYSDTDGFQQDAERRVWPWRDWVIDSFNSNRPFDEFTRWQIAGDLLPNATAEQKLATCFHRNHMNNGEGGRDPAESRVDYVLDRTNTTGRVWLGLTVGCAQCHDHKFDPISQVDYYRLSAYFDNIDETGRAGGAAKPYLQYQSSRGKAALDRAEAALRDEKARYDRALSAAKPSFEAFLTRAVERVRGGFESWQALAFDQLTAVEGSRLTADGAVVTARAGDRPHDDFVLQARTPPLHRITGLRLEVLSDPDHVDGRYSNGPGGDFVLTNVKLRVRNPSTAQVRDIGLRGVVADLERQQRGETIGRVRGTLDDDPRTGWTTFGLKPDPKNPAHRGLDFSGDRVAVFELAEPLVLHAGERLEVVMMHRAVRLRAIIGRFRWSVTDQRATAVRSLHPMPLAQLADCLDRRAAYAGPAPMDRVVAAAVAPEADWLPKALRSRLFEQFAADHAPLVAAKARFDTFRRQRDALRRQAKPMPVPVLAERKKRRQSYVLERGVWDQHGSPVTAGVPEAVLPRASASDRLALADWLVDPNHPLTARVLVNQFWQLLFGYGLVRTPGDFGQQGEVPTHPELLDWLAIDWMESGWDVQHLLRWMVTSRTYRQSSARSTAQEQRDPENRLLARANRYRLPSWMIRDAMLQASGLLFEELGGPPVYPHQPPGVWADQFMGRIHYRSTLGPEQYRRSLYAFWRRTSAPTFLFDVATRRECEMAPRRTNTPLHALTLWNDKTAMLAARALARRLNAHTELDAYVQALGRAVLGREWSGKEKEQLATAWRRSVELYQRSPKLAEALVGDSAMRHWGSAGEPDLADAAARIVLANLIFNLDEAMTRE